LYLACATELELHHGSQPLVIESLAFLGYLLEPAPDGVGPAGRRRRAGRSDRGGGWGGWGGGGLSRYRAPHTIGQSRVLGQSLAQALAFSI
jgi:hypothetical protein